MSAGSSRDATAIWSPCVTLRLGFSYLVPVLNYIIDAVPTLGATPKAPLNSTRFDIIFQIGNQKLNGGKFRACIDRLPAGPERKSHTSEYVRAMKQVSRSLKDLLGFMRKTAATEQ